MMRSVVVSAVDSSFSLLDGIQELLSKNENRKQVAVEAAALAASQRGLLGAITLVVSTNFVLRNQLPRPLHTVVLINYDTELRNQR